MIANSIDLKSAAGLSLDGRTPGPPTLGPRTSHGLVRLSSTIAVLVEHEATSYTVGFRLLIAPDSHGSKVFGRTLRKFPSRSRSGAIMTSRTNFSCLWGWSSPDLEEAYLPSFLIPSRCQDGELLCTPGGHGEGHILRWNRTDDPIWWHSCETLDRRFAVLSPSETVFLLTAIWVSIDCFLQITPPIFCSVSDGA